MAEDTHKMCSGLGSPLKHAAILMASVAIVLYIRASSPSLFKGGPKASTAHSTDSVSPWGWCCLQ